MRKFFENWEWEDTLYATLLVIVLLLVGTLWTTVTADHRVRIYYLSGSYEGGLKIKGDCDWADDVTIVLDRSITYEGAIQMVTDLNTNLLYDED